MLNQNPLLNAVAAGLGSTLITLVSFMLVPYSLFLSYFSAVPLYWIGFVQGKRHAFIAFVVAFVLHSFVSANIDISFLVVTALPLAYFFFLYEKPNPKKKTKSLDWYELVHNMIIAQLGFVLLGVTLLFASGGDISHTLAKPFVNMLKQTNGVMGEQLVVLFPGFMLMSWVSMTFFNAHMAYNIALKQKKTKIRKIPNRFNMPLYWDVGLVLGILLFLVGSYMNIMILAVVGPLIGFAAVVPLSLIGWRLIYMWFESRQIRPQTFWILVFFSFLLAWPLLFVVILGFIEPWYALSRRFHKIS